MEFGPKLAFNKNRVKALIQNRNPLKQKASRPIVTCIVTNFPAADVEKFA